MLTHKFPLNKKFRRTALILIDINKSKTRSLTKEIVTSLSSQSSQSLQFHNELLLKIFYGYSSTLYDNCSKYDGSKQSVLRNTNVLVNQCAKLIEDYQSHNLEYVRGRSFRDYDSANMNIEIAIQKMKIMIDLCNSCVFHFNFDKPEFDDNVFIIRSENVTKLIITYMGLRNQRLMLYRQNRKELLFHDMMCDLFREIDGFIMNHISRAFIKINIIENMDQFVTTTHIIGDNIVLITMTNRNIGTIHVYTDTDTNMSIIWISPLLMGNNFLFERC